MADPTNATPAAKKFKSREESKKAKNAESSSVVQNDQTANQNTSSVDANQVLKNSLDTITTILKQTNDFLKNTEKSINKINANTSAAAESSKTTKENLRVIESRAKRTSAFLEAALESAKDSKRKTKSIATNVSKIKRPVANDVETTKENQIWRDKVLNLLSIIANKRDGRMTYTRRRPRTRAEKREDRGIVANLVTGLTSFYAGRLFGTLIGGIIGNAVAKPISMLGGLITGTIGLALLPLKAIAKGITGIFRPSSTNRRVSRRNTGSGRKIYRGAKAIARKTGSAAKSVGSKLAAGIGMAYELVKTLLGKLPGMFSKIKDFAIKAAEIVKNISSKAYDLAKALFSKIPDIFSKISSAVKAGAEMISSIISKAFGFIKSLLGGKKEGAEYRPAAEMSKKAKPDAKMSGRYAEKVATKETESVAKKSGTKALAKGLLKTGGKVALKTAAKSIPLLGAAVGAGYAVKRAMEGDFKGAAVELGSGIVGSTGIGAPVALAAEGYLAKRDMDKAEALTKNNTAPAAPKIETTQKLENVVSQSADIESKKNSESNSKPIIIDNTKNISQGGKQQDAIVRIHTKNNEPTKQFLDRLTISSSYMGTGFILT